MKAADPAKRHILGSAILSAILIAAIDFLTNSLDTQKFSWDFRYYIAMAQNGFNAPLASPFAYRYLTPALVYGLIHFLGVPIETGFRIIAYLGAFLQLWGVFLFTNWFTRSTRGAYVALAVTALSLFNVKFLLFDIYRPDHLAYALILLQTYFALKRKFLPLFLSTLLASQIREFNIIPLIAYLFALARSLLTQHRVALPEGAPHTVSETAASAKERRTFVREAAISALGLAVALVLPRLLIPVTENYQFADLSRDGILRVLIAPLVLARDANFIYSLVAYFLPVLMITGLGDLQSIWESLGVQTRSFLLAYVSLVLAFSFLGGTDFYRFSTFLFMPQAILLGFLVARRSPLEIGVMLAGIFIFNRIWLPFPMSDAGSYLDFYGGSATRFNWASVLRLVECLLFIAVGILLRRLRPSTGFQSPLTI